jgi:hypothetical protein
MAMLQHALVKNGDYDDYYNDDDTILSKCCSISQDHLIIIILSALYNSTFRLNGYDDTVNFSDPTTYQAT